MTFPLSKLNVVIRIIIRFLQVIINVDKSTKHTKNGDINDNDSTKAGDTEDSKTSQSAGVNDSETSTDGDDKTDNNQETA